MTSPENESEHPIWEGAIVGLLFAVDNNLLPMEHALGATSQVCVDLIRGNMLPDLGTLQRYLRLREATVQLVSQPYDPHSPGLSQFQPVDIRTGEVRSHWMMVSVGERGAEAQRQLGRLGISNDQNETLLARDTGMLTIRHPE